MQTSKTSYSRPTCARTANHPVAQRIAILFLLLACADVALAAAPPLLAADPQRYLDDIKALSAPAMEGRGAGTKGMTRAEHLIEKRYKSLGLEPAGTDSYLQPFHRDHGRATEREEQISCVTRRQKRELKAKQDFVPFSFSGFGIGARRSRVRRLRHYRRRVSLRRLRRHRRQGQDCRGAAL
jgi:hypothetical protein